MFNLNFRAFTFTVILTLVGSTTEAEIYNINYSMGCLSYYAKEVGLADPAFCLILCNVKEDCVGVAVENKDQNIICYFLSASRSDTKMLKSSPQIQQWIKGKIN